MSINTCPTMVRLEPLLDQKIMDVAWTKKMSKNDLMSSYINQGLKLKKIPFKVKKEEAKNKFPSKTLYISQEADKQLKQIASKLNVSQHTLMCEYIMWGFKATKDEDLVLCWINKIAYSKKPKEIKENIVLNKTINAQLKSYINKHENLNQNKVINRALKIGLEELKRIDKEELNK